MLKFCIASNFVCGFVWMDAVRSASQEFIVLMLVRLRNFVHLSSFNIYTKAKYVYKCFLFYIQTFIFIVFSTIFLFSLLSPNTYICISTQMWCHVMCMYVIIYFWYYFCKVLFFRKPRAQQGKLRNFNFAWV